MTSKIASKIRNSLIWPKQSQSSRMNVSKVFVLRFSLCFKRSFSEGRKLPKWTMHFYCVLYFAENRRCVLLLLNYWYIVDFHGCNHNRNQTEDYGWKFLSFYHFSVFTGGLKTGKSFDLWLINSMFLFAVLFERLLCGCFA